MAICVSLFLFTLCFYLRTLCATFNINDSGETIMDCDLLALAHSPGYPFHTLVGRIFCFLPLGQPMFRLTFGSAVMGAASVALVYAIARRLLEGLPGGPVEAPRFRPRVSFPALFSSLVFAFSYQHWFQSGGGKGSIYTLNTLLAVSTLLILLKMREPGWFKRGFFLALFFLGLALSVHWETQAVLLPAYAWFLFSAQNRVDILEVGRNLLRPFDLWEILKRFVQAFGGKAGWVRASSFLLLPLSTYLYLPLRSSAGPALNWYDPKTLDHFLTVVSRGNYAGVAGARSLETIHRNFARFWLHAQDQFGASFTFLFLALGVAGLAWLWQNRRMDAVGLLLYGGGVFGGVVFYTPSRAGYEWTLDNFFTPVFLMATLFMGGALAGLKRWVMARGFSRVVGATAAAASLVLALLPLALNYPSEDQSAYTVSYEEGLNLLKTANRQGVILCNGDIDILPLWYLQMVQGKRPEVASFTTQLVGLKWYRDDVTHRWPFLATALEGDVPPWNVVGEMVRLHGVERSFYTTNIDFPSGDTAWMAKAFPWLPDGVMWRMANTRGQSYAFNSARVNQLWSQYQLRNLNPPERKYWDDYTDVMRDSYGQACSFTGQTAMGSGNPQLAQWSYEKSLQYHQPQQWGFNYLGLADAELAQNLTADAISHYQQALRWEPHGPSGPYLYAPYAYAKLGDAFLMEKDIVNAEDAFQASLRLNPQQKEALEGLERLEGVRRKS